MDTKKSLNAEVNSLYSALSLQLLLISLYYVQFYFFFSNSSNIRSLLLPSLSLLLSNLLFATVRRLFCSGGRLPARNT